MVGRRSGWAAGLALGLIVALLAGHVSRGTAAAACMASDPPFAVYFSSPPGSQGLYATGPAPLTVTMTIVGGVIDVGGGDITGSFVLWGDGSQSAIATAPCEDGSVYWAAQNLTHTYTGVINYIGGWQVNTTFGTIPVPGAFFTVAVTAAAPTPTATTAPPTATPTKPPATSTAQPGATATRTAPPGATAVPGASTTVAAGTRSATPSASAVTGTPASTASATPGGTSTPGPSPTPSPGGATQEPTTVVPAPGGDDLPPPSHPDVPQVLSHVRAPEDVPTDAGAVAISLAIAGATVWVLFSSVLLDQYFEEYREDVERRTAGLRRPFARLFAFAGATPPGWWRTAAEGAGVLAVIGLIYTLAEPGLGWNADTGVLFASVVIGVGFVTYLTCGAEILALRRIAGVRATVKPYAATLVIAVVSVAITRLFDLRPGVVYGFVASTVIVGGVETTRAQEGKIALIPVAVGLAAAVGAWLLVGPIRALDSDAWGVSLAEATAVTIFVGGIEGTVFSMIPLAATDGGKLYRWKRAVWVGVTLTAGFLAWHVLLGTERGYFSSLRPADSLVVLGVFAFYVAVTAAVIWWFQFRKREGGPASSES